MSESVIQFRGAAEPVTEESQTAGSSKLCHWRLGLFAPARLG